MNLGGRQGEVRRPGHRVGEPAELVLELGPRDDGGIEAHPRHRGERLAVGDREVDHPVGAAGGERAGERRLRVPRQAQRPGQQVGGAVRHDPERYPGPSQALGAAAHGAVAADGDHEVRARQAPPR